MATIARIIFTVFMLLPVPRLVDSGPSVHDVDGGGRSFHLADVKHLPSVGFD
jgi:hypothetical protein